MPRMLKDPRAVMVVCLALLVSVTGHYPAPKERWEEEPGGLKLESAGLDGFEDKEDPLVWLKHDLTGLYYRRVTDNEVESNGWVHSTYLIELEPGLDAVRQGSNSFAFIVPLNDSYVEVFDMRLVREDRMNFSEGPGVEPEEWRMRTYEGYQNASQKVAHVIGGEHGGLYGEAVFNESDLDILGTINGPEPRWVIDDLLTEDGTTVNESAVVAVPLSGPGPEYEQLTCIVLESLPARGMQSTQCDDDDESEGTTPRCDDGEDNDGDEWTDYPEDPGCDSADDDDEWDSPTEREFHLMGEIKWCTGHGDGNWQSRISDIAFDIEDAFRGERDTRVDLVASHGFCWVHEDGHDMAVDCATGETAEDNCTWGDGHVYQYYNAENESVTYRDEAWNYSNHWQDHNDSIPDVHAIQVIHEGPLTYEGDGQICGLASFPDLGDQWDSNVSGPKPTGDSVAGNDGVNCPTFWLTPSHEMGHNFNAWHGDNETAPTWGNCPTLMFDNPPPNCREDAFSDDNRRNVNHCIDDHTDKCPRAGTG